MVIQYVNNSHGHNHNMFLVVVLNRMNIFVGNIISKLAGSVVFKLAGEFVSKMVGDIRKKHSPEKNDFLDNGRGGCIVRVGSS